MTDEQRRNLAIGVSAIMAVLLVAIMLGPYIWKNCLCRRRYRGSSNTDLLKTFAEFGNF